MVIPRAPSSPQTPLQRVLSQSRTSTLYGGQTSAWTVRTTAVPSTVQAAGV